MKARLGFLQRRHLTSMGGRMALAAVAFHLIVSFVHVHPQAVPAPTRAGVAASEVAPSSDTPLGPVTDGNCAICANIAAFASLDVPRPAGLPLIAVRVLACIFLRLSSRPERPCAYQLFQTRAPPAAASSRPF